MNNNFLTTKKVFLGILGSFMEHFFGDNVDKNNIKNSNVIKRQGKESPKSIVKIVKNKKQYISKNVSFKFKTLAYYQLANEFSMLNFLNSKFKDINFPKVTNFVIDKHFINLEIEYVKGNQLNKFGVEEITNTLLKIISSMKNTSNKLSVDEKKNLPKRNVIFTIFNFYIYFAILFFKDFTLLKNSFGLISLFTKNIKYLLNAKLVLSHKDLSAENVLITNKNEIYIIDPDVCTLSLEDTDTAMIARFYLNILKTEGTIKLIKKLLRSKQQQKRFIALSIYYSFQMLIIENKNSPFYLQAKKYLATFPTLIQTFE